MLPTVGRTHSRATSRDASQKLPGMNAHVAHLATWRDAHGLPNRAADLGRSAQVSVVQRHHPLVSGYRQMTGSGCSQLTGEAQSCTSASEGGRAARSLAATCSACSITRNTFNPASFATSASDHPRRIISSSNAGYRSTAFQALRSRGNAVEVGTDADVIDACNLADVFDVIGDFRQGHDRLRMGFFPGCQVLLSPSQAGRCTGLHTAESCSECVRQRNPPPIDSRPRRRRPDRNSPSPRRRSSRPSAGRRQERCAGDC